MWWNLVWWLVICNGCCAAGAAIINRVHGFPLPEWAIPYTHKINGLMLLSTGALTLIAVVGLGTRLPYGSRWDELPVDWKLAGAFCAVSTLIFWISVIRRHFRRPPVQEIRSGRRRHLISHELGTPLAGAGPFSWMTRLPRNEIFHLEITERDLVIPRLPPAWDGLTILHFTDVHFIGTVARPYFERVLEHAQDFAPDMICFTGDLLDDLDLLTWLPSTLGRLTAPEGKFFVLGNHDQQLNMDTIRHALAGLGWHDVAASSRELQRDGQVLHIAGSEYPWVNRQPSYDGVSDSTLRILLSHTPDNLPRAKRERVDLMLSGHVHGGQIRLPVIGPIYCPSWFGCYYSEGLFWESPTLLHVGRGLAGRQPLRWGCLPEITKLTLHCPR